MSAPAFLRSGRSAVVASLLVLLSCSSAAQTSKETPATTGVPKFFVSPQQERNFNSLISWMDAEASFKQKNGLKSAYRGLFVAMKQNNYTKFASWWKKFGVEFSKLTDEQKNAIGQFLLALPAGEPTECPDPGSNGCMVKSILGSCTVQCSAGTKPKCYSKGGIPQCGCEPYAEAP